jgi:hypothetical protein
MILDTKTRPVTILTANYTSIFQTVWEPRRLTTLGPPSACYLDIFTYTVIFHTTMKF